MDKIDCFIACKEIVLITKTPDHHALQNYEKNTTNIEIVFVRSRCDEIFLKIGFIGFIVEV